MSELKKNYISYICASYGIDEKELKMELKKHGIMLKKNATKIPYRFLYEIKGFLERKKAPSRISELPPSIVPKTLQDKSEIIIKEKQFKRKSKEEKKAETELKKAWPIIGPIEDMFYLSSKEVEQIHFILVEDFRNSKDPIEPPGVKMQSLLDSAVFRPQTTLGSNIKYPSVAMAGGALLHALVHNHPFHNGNKRTALVSLLVFLDKNNWITTLIQDDIYEFLMRLASHKIVEINTVTNFADEEVISIAMWLQASLRRVRKGDKPLQFRRLENILTRYGCSFDLSGNKMRISRSGFLTVIHYDDRGRDVAPETIQKLRKDLKLDEKSGCDSNIFYNRESRIPDFINKYRKVLSRLAKV